MITYESFFQKDRDVTGYKDAHRQKDRYMSSFRNNLFHRKGRPTFLQIALNRNSTQPQKVLRMCESIHSK